MEHIPVKIVELNWLLLPNVRFGCGDILVSPPCGEDSNKLFYLFEMVKASKAVIVVNAVLFRLF